MRFVLILATFAASALASPLASLPAGTAIPNQYIVLFKETAAEDKIATHQTWLQSAATGDINLERRGLNLTGYPNIPKYSGFNYLHKYSGAGPKFRGYSAKISASIAAALKDLPEVAHVEQDTVVKLAATQANAPSWGLQRISQPSLPLPSTYTYPDSAGTGVDVYIVDTGIQVSHPDFAGRAVWDGNYAGDGSDTDVAGTVGSNTYGVAKKVTLHAVKVLDASGSGTNSGVIAGVNYVATKGKSGSVKVVANMSLGGGASTALDSAVSAAISAGVAFAIAAGNSAADACNSSPSRVSTAFTVGATSSTDGFASFSNYGSCVDILAPGVNILSTWTGSSTNTISGTSMATPHVAGVLALLAGLKTYTSVASLLADAVSLTAKSKISSVPSGTVNYLLQVPASGSTTTSVVTTPVSTTATTTATTPTTTAVTCAHSYCVTGVALTCKDACVVKIVAADSYCGTTSWDSICVGEVKSICGITC
ncbi:subtilisin-like serine protease [Phlyctochytrium planicorne]|nr:subtilisin-like serine protease [Phlyctochytrium planicorne]